MKEIIALKIMTEDLGSFFSRPRARLAESHVRLQMVYKKSVAC